MVKPAQHGSRTFGPGDKLGKYELIRQVAIGGMAELYLARTVGIEGFEKLVVVKRILPQYLSNASFVTMFLNEARLAATLHHPNIAQVYDIGLDEADYFFAMEYVHGEDLAHVITSSTEQGVPLSLDAALTLAAGLCAGLHYAHEKVGPDGRALEVVHRDVSPSNVLVSYDGSVKLVDFGIARAMMRQPQSTQGGLKGKIAYMSPEQGSARGALDRRSDLYSLGTLIYELTTGRLPFTAETDYAVLHQIVNNDVPPPTTFVREYPPALEKIVLTALARDPERRYPTALALQTAIEDFAHENRLRISPLVLARVMGTLFPARLEEWDSAKAQGAFFVEQHVVRTLIESGRSQPQPDAEEDTSVQPVPTDLGGDTSIGPPPITTDTGRIPTPVPGSGYPEPPPPAPAEVRRTSSPAIGRPITPEARRASSPAIGRPVTPEARRASSPAIAQPVTPEARRASSPAIARASSPAIAQPVTPEARRASSPAIAQPAERPSAEPLPPPPHTPVRTPVVPGMPGAVPIIAAPGVLVSAMSTPPTGLVPLRAPSQVDVTERVRIPSRPRISEAISRRRPLIMIAVAALVIAGAAATFLAVRVSTPTPAATPPRDQAAEKAAADQAVADRAAADQAAADRAAADKAAADKAAADKAAADKAAADKAAAEQTAADKAAELEKAKKAAKVIPKPHPRPAPPKPDAKPEPKEKPWNADSPFMPVRTDKR